MKRLSIMQATLWSAIMIPKLWTLTCTERIAIEITVINAHTGWQNFAGECTCIILDACINFVLA